MAQGCDLEVPLVGERPSALPPGGHAAGVVLGDSWRSCRSGGPRTGPAVPAW